MLPMPKNHFSTHFWKILFNQLILPSFSQLSRFIWCLREKWLCTKLFYSEFPIKKVQSIFYVGCFGIPKNLLYLLHIWYSLSIEFLQTILNFFPVNIAFMRKMVINKINWFLISNKKVYIHFFNSLHSKLKICSVQSIPTNFGFGMQ